VVVQSIRVLIVDDSEDDALLLVRQLRHSGFDPSFERVDTAEAMNAALEKLTWDLVLSDFMMPRFGGLEAVELLRRRGFDIPILIVSGKIGEETAVECVKAGASDYLMKDNLKRLGTAVERELRETENRRIRRIAEERLRATDANLRRVINSSADGIVVVAGDGTIRFVNPAAESLFGQTADRMVGTSFGFLLGERIDLEIVRDDGSRVVAEMRVVELDWEGATAHLATLRDITERRDRVRALQESETRLRLLLGQIPCLTWTLDNRLKFTSFAGSGSEVVEDAPGRIVGRTLREYFKEDELDFAPYVAHRQALQGTPADYELSWAGRTFYGRVEALRDADDRTVGVVGVAFDITDRKQAEEQLRSLSRLLTTAQEKERRKIARELHDEVGQSLTALKLYLDKAALEQSRAYGSELADARRTLGALMVQVRSMSLELRPTMLDDLGLLPTLLWHFKRYTAQTNVQVHFRHRGLRRDLPQDTITAAYRIVQEALTNVARHAQASKVQVSVRAEGDALVVEVEDQGVGFDLDRVGAASMGLGGMRERAISLDGKLLVQSKPGEGTCVIAELPLPERVRRPNKKPRRR
jgi:PAS domain S-box-containing protein